MDYAGILKENELLKDKITTLTSWAIRVDHLEKENSKLNSEFKILKKNCEEARASSDFFESAFKSLTVKNDRDVTSLKSSQEEVKSLKNEIVSLKNEIVTQKNKNDFLNKENNSLKKEISLLRLKL